MPYRFGDILIVNFPYTDRPDFKKRPALVFSQDDDGDLVLFRITSQKKEMSTDVILRDWMQTKLRLPSIVRLNKIVTAHESFANEHLGRLSDHDRKQIIAALREYISSVESH